MTSLTYISFVLINILSVNFGQASCRTDNSTLMFDYIRSEFKKPFEERYRHNGAREKGMAYKAGKLFRQMGNDLRSDGYYEDVKEFARKTSHYKTKASIGKNTWDLFLKGLGNTSRKIGRFIMGGSDKKTYPRLLANYIQENKRAGISKSDLSLVIASLLDDEDKGSSQKNFSLFQRTLKKIKARGVYIDRLFGVNSDYEEFIDGQARYLMNLAKEGNDDIDMNDKSKFMELLQKRSGKALYKIPSIAKRSKGESLSSSVKMYLDNIYMNLVRN